MAAIDFNYAQQMHYPLLVFRSVASLPVQGKRTAFYTHPRSQALFGLHELPARCRIISPGNELGCFILRIFWSASLFALPLNYNYSLKSD